jgi:hypothetical protein
MNLTKRNQVFWRDRTILDLSWLRDDPMSIFEVKTWFRRRWLPLTRNQVFRGDRTILDLSWLRDDPMSTLEVKTWFLVGERVAL